MDKLDNDKRNTINVTVALAKINLELVDYYTKLFYGGNRSEFVRASIMDKLEKCAKIMLMHSKIKDTANPEYRKIELIVPKDEIKYQDLMVYNE